MTFVRGLGAMLLIWVVFAACSTPAPQSSPSVGGGPAPSTSPGQPKRVVAVLRGNPFTLSEAVNAAGAGSVPGVDELQGLIHAGLGIEDPDRQIRARLAEQMPTVENGGWKVFPDGTMETTWRIHPNVVWHDGTPFTSDDLAFTIRVAQHPQVQLSGSQTFALIDSVETPDPRSLVVRWKQPFIQADLLLTHSGASRILPLPRHLMESTFNADPASITDGAYWTTEFVGLGPFQVRQYSEGSHMVLSAYDRYYLGRPQVDEIEVKFMTDPGTIAANLLAGAVELTLGGRFSLEWGISVRDQWRAGRMETPVGTSWVALFPQMLNPTPPVLAESSFRQALLHAINRQEMSETIQAGLSPIAHSLIAPSDPEYGVVERSIVRFDYDPRRAAQILEGMGYRKGSDAIFRDPANEPLRIEMRTRQGDDLQEKTLFGVMGYWQQLGVGVDPTIFPAQRANDREFRATHSGLEVVRQPSGSEAVPRYHGSETPLPENQYRGINRTRYRNAEFDGLIDRYRSTIPLAERNQVLAQIIQHMTTQVNPLGIYWALDPTMIGNRLVNVAGRNPTWNAHEWRVQG